MIGKTVSGRFEILQLAGSGGMGAVYRARDLTDGNTVAVKILTGRELREAERFDLEAAILAELTHPAIVRYVAHGVEGEDHFIAMEWLEGEDLATRIDRKPVTVAESVGLVRRSSEALAYAHTRGIVHRDIKPENLFLPGGDIARLKVLDFGIARLTHGGRKLTLTGSVIGTPGYMAPELVRGERNVRPSADVFSLGCVLFQCLTGRAVFEAEEATALLAKILLQDAPRAREIAPGIPAALDDVVASMLAKDPAKRLADAQAVIDALDKMRAVELEGLTTAAAARRPQPALTATEQRIACVVIAGPSATAEERWYGATPPLGLKTGGARPPSSTSVGRVEELEGELSRVHGARLHSLPGGSVVIVLPDAGKPNDQTARAARCALAVRNELPDVPLVVATGPGRFSAWSVAGEVIDNGMRLLRATAPGAIRLDDVAVGLLDARFEIRRDGSASFLRAERDVFEVKRNLLGRASDFVGRGREMSMLSNLYTSALAESTASAVLVTGAAGVGKSRLRQEFVEWVGKQRERAEVLFGVGDSLGAGSPFAMIAMCLRRTAGIQEGEPLEERRRKLVERVSRHVDREIVPRVAAFLGEIANVPFPDDQNEALRMARQNPQVMGDAMRRSWEDWLSAECAAHPVLLLLEDLHWGDLGTVSFIDAALRNLREQPFMVLAMGRPDVHARFPELWSEREMQIIRLAPLSKRASEKLVREALGPGVPDSLIEQLIARADGNAFYLEELIRATAAGRHEALPDSVIGMVQARLDAEGPQARRVLRAASVFGERFSQSGVAALLGGESELSHVAEWLELLATRELVARAAGAERRGGILDVEYTFTHALVREAAYAMLTHDDRVLGHRLAGAWLESEGASSDAMALAEHFRRGAEPARAVRWYERAAAQALKANDLTAAIERAELGLSCGAAGEVLGALRLIQAEGHVWRGEFAEAERHALAAAAACPPGSAAALRALGSALVSAAKQGKLDVVEDLVRRVSQVPPEPTARGAQISCLAWGATYLIFGGRIAAADALMVLVSEISRGLTDLDPQAQALIQQVRSFRASASGDLGGCLTGLEAALVSFELAGDLRNACSTRANLGYIYCELGDFARAESALRQALSETARMGLHELAAAVQHNLGRVLGLRGQTPEAAHLEREAIASVKKQGEPRVEGVARTYLSEILAASGDYAGAEREAALAVETLRVAPSLRVAALGALARARLGRGDVTSALEAAREAAAELAALGEIEEGESSVRLTHAEALAHNGEDAEARVVLETARERLLARAARIEEVAWRERFLYAVPVNARILALASQWGAQTPPRTTTAERPRHITGTGPISPPAR